MFKFDWFKIYFNEITQLEVVTDNIDIDIGLPKSPVCPICLIEESSFMKDELDSLNCGHIVCKPCLTRYLQNAIETEFKSA